jgi:DNA polymerase III sliding clamp (beta) subunit (PCNA family)
MAHRSLLMKVLNDARSSDRRVGYPDGRAMPPRQGPVRFDIRLRPRSLELSASSPESGSASAKLPARFMGGGDSVIHTGFNPDYLREAVKTLSGDRIVFDVAQNSCGLDGKVFSKAALLYAADDEHVRWVLMPIHMG